MKLTINQCVTELKAIIWRLIDELNRNKSSPNGATLNSSVTEIEDYRDKIEMNVTTARDNFDRQYGLQPTTRELILIDTSIHLMQTRVDEFQVELKELSSLIEHISSKQLLTQLIKLLIISEKINDALAIGRHAVVKLKST